MIFSLRTLRAKKWIRANVIMLCDEFLTKLDTYIKNALAEKSIHAHVNLPAAIGFCLWCIGLAISVSRFSQRNKEYLLDYYNDHFSTVVLHHFQDPLLRYFSMMGTSFDEFSSQLRDLGDYSNEFVGWRETDVASAESMEREVLKKSPIQIPYLFDAFAGMFLFRRLLDAFSKRGGLVIDPEITSDEQDILWLQVTSAFRWAVTQSLIGLNENKPVDIAAPY